jgi:hypothetical protein
MMKNIYCLCACLLLTACEAIPHFNKCHSPKFAETDMVEIPQYFLTEDIFAKFCPAETPQKFSHQITPTITLSAHLKDEWMYLKAKNGITTVSLYAKGLRLTDYNGFTHVLPVSTLRGNTLPLIIDRDIKYEMNFTTIKCTCID